MKIPGIFLILALLAGQWGISAQNRVSNPDSLFSVARDSAFAGQREVARAYCYDILEAYPGYIDARVLIGRTLAWDKDYDSARIVLIHAIEMKKTYKDAYEALIDIETWSKNYHAALMYCNQALDYHPNNENLMARKADLQFRLGQTNEAKNDIRDLLAINPSHEKARELLKKFKHANILNKFSLNYNFEYFDEPWARRWHLLSLAYSRKTKIGSVIARVYAGDVVQNGEKLFSNNYGLQYEIEAYPKLTRKNYAYVAYAYSPDRVFPRHRAGLEVYQKLPASFELSLGGRYMQFVSSEGSTKNLMIYTGSLGYYFRNFWVSFRPYITPKGSEVSQSYYVELRNYFKSKDQFLSITAGTGSSPDDPNNDIGDFNRYKLNKYKIRFSYQHLFFSRLIIEWVFAYQNEEYKQDKDRNVLSGAIKTSLYF